MVQRRKGANFRQYEDHSLEIPEVIEQPRFGRPGAASPVTG
jgi:hypothetical protein